MTLRRVDLGHVSRIAVGLTAGVAVFAHLTGLADGTSVLLGGAFMVLDFHLIRMLVSLLIRPELGPWGRFWAPVLLTLKFLLVVVLVAGVFYQFPVEPMSFALGASMLLVASVSEAAWMGEPVEAADGPAGR